MTIDRGLLTALLETGHYRNGARSMEKLVLYMRQSGVLPLKRAHLPPDRLLSLYVEDVEGFHKIMQRSHEFMAKAKQLARVIHEDYRQALPEKEKGSSSDIPFEELSAELQESNIAAAMRIESILALAGFVLEAGAATPEEETAVAAVLEQNIERLAEAEHDGWADQKKSEGWTYGPVRDNARRIHHLLVAHDALPEEQKNKHRQTIRNYPKYARLAGFKIVAKRPE